MENLEKLVMASSSAHGVAAVTLPKFSTLGDPQQNCEKFIQLFKDWCELNRWYNSESLPPPTKPPPPTGPVWQAKGRAMVAFNPAIARNEGLENLVQGFQL